MKLPKREGFTVIELVITLVIVSVLATIALQWLWRAKDQAMQRTIQSDLRFLATQQEAYYSSNRAYAADLAVLTEYRTSPGVLVEVNNSTADGWAAIGTHPSLSGYQCGIMIGTVPAGAAPPAVRTGVVTCGAP